MNEIIKISTDAKIIQVNTEKLKKLGKKYGFTFSKEDILKNNKNGDVIFIRQKDSGKQIAYILHEIYFQKFSMKYSAHQKIKSGKELFISNFKLLKFSIK